MSFAQLSESDSVHGKSLGCCSSVLNWQGHAIGVFAGRPEWPQMLVLLASACRHSSAVQRVLSSLKFMLSITGLKLLKLLPKQFVVTGEVPACSLFEASHEYCTPAGSDTRSPSTTWTQPWSDLGTFATILVSDHETTVTLVKSLVPL